MVVYCKNCGRNTAVCIDVKKRELNNLSFSEKIKYNIVDRNATVKFYSCTYCRYSWTK